MFIIKHKLGRNQCFFKHTHFNIFKSIITIDAVTSSLKSWGLLFSPDLYCVRPVIIALHICSLTRLQYAIDSTLYPYLVTIVCVEQLL